MIWGCFIRLESPNRYKKRQRYLIGSDKHLKNVTTYFLKVSKTLCNILLTEWRLVVYVPALRRHYSNYRSAQARPVEMFVHGCAKPFP